MLRNLFGSIRKKALQVVSKVADMTGLTNVAIKALLEELTTVFQERPEGIDLSFVDSIKECRKNIENSKDHPDDVHFYKEQLACLVRDDFGSFLLQILDRAIDNNKLVPCKQKVKTLLHSKIKDNFLDEINAQNIDIFLQHKFFVKFFEMQDQLEAGNVNLKEFVAMGLAFKKEYEAECNKVNEEMLPMEQSINIFAQHFDHFYISQGYNLPANSPVFSPINNPRSIFDFQ